MPASDPYATDAVSRSPNARTLSRSSSGRRIVNGQSSPASTPAIQSSEPTRMRSSVPSSVSIKFAERRRDALRRLVDREVEQHLHLPVPRHPRQRAADLGDGVEAVRRICGRLVHQRHLPHPVDPERAQVVAAVVERGQVPPAGVDDEAVRAELAVALVARECAIPDLKPSPPPDRLRQKQRRPAAHRSGRRHSLGERERRLERLHPPAQGIRKDAVELHDRVLDVRSEPLRRHQPEHDRHRLVLGQHERRQPEPGPHAVAAADAALALDWNPELLERRHVAPHRAAVDLEPIGDLLAGRERPGLEELQQVEEAGAGFEHVPK